jgi:hypothetical protein
MHGAHGLNGAFDRLQLGLQQRVAARVKRGHPGVGQRLAGVRLDARGLAAHRLANEDPHALVRRQRPAGLVQHGAQHAIGDGLAVHQHAVAVEQDCFKFHSYGRFLGKRWIRFCFGL